MRMRLKVEINTREHFAVLGFTKRTFSVDSRWYSGRADIATFELDELLAAKLRALFQRRKGRDSGFPTTGFRSTTGSHLPACLCPRRQAPRIARGGRILASKSAKSGGDMVANGLPAI